MSIFLSNEEFKTIRKASMLSDYSNLYRSLIERVAKYTNSPGLSNSETSTDWWHHCYEYLTETAFVCVVESNANKARTWLRNNVLNIVNCSMDDWIGPDFRDHLTTPLNGNLETAHLAMAIAICLDLVPDIFTESERDDITKALKDKAIPLCLNKLNSDENLTNWHSVMLAGLSVSAAVVNDIDALKYAIKKYELCLDSIQPDGSYGESFQYANYCGFGLMMTHEALSRSVLSNKFDLSIEPYAKLIKYFVHNYLYNTPIEGWGKYPRPRFVNFNDSGAICGPDPDLLMHISAKAKETMPEIAGMSRWLFDEFYTDYPSQGPFDRNSFGFINRYGFISMLYYPIAAKAQSPEKLPDYYHFSNGECFNRNSWDKSRTVLAFNGASEGVHDVGHHHADLNNVILAHNNERLLVDPGHCCYRNMSHLQNIKTQSHSTCTFFVKKGLDGNAFEELEQSTCPPRRFIKDGWETEAKIPQYGKFLLAAKIDDVCVFASDAAKAYGAPVEVFSRFCIMCGEHVVFFLDIIKTSAPASTCWRWVMNNRDNQLEHKMVYGDRVVIRRGNSGMKFFHLGDSQASSPMFCSIHDAYHPLANQLGENVSGSGIIYRWKENERSGTRMIAHAAALDSYGAVTGWHLKKISSEKFSLEGYKRWCNWQIEFNKDKILVNETISEKAYIIKPSTKGIWQLKKGK